MLQAFYRSFYDTSFYRRVVAGKGIGMPFLLATSLLLAVVLMVIIISSQEFKELTSDEAIARFPVMTLDHGELTIDRESPYRLDIEGEAILFDTSPEGMGKLPADQIFDWMKQNKVVAVLTRTHAYTEKQNGRYEVIDFSEAKGETLTLTHDDIRKFIGLVPYFLLPLAWVGLLLYRLGQMLLYGLAGIGIARILRMQVDYATLCRITVYALWPVTVAEVLIGLVLGLDSPVLITLLALMTYQAVALRSVQR